jgi:hypothetical protein
MLPFKKFLKAGIAPILIPSDPVHGAHSRKQIAPILIPSDPVHGAHSKPKRSLKEETVHGYHKWMEKHNNHHLGKNHEEVHEKINQSKEDFEKNPDHHHLMNYSDSSYVTNHNLLKLAKKEKPEWADGQQSKKFNKKRKKHVVRMVNGLDRTFKRDDSKLKHDLHVYHGTDKFNPGELASQHPDRKIKSAAYMSTSINKKQVEAFAGRHNNSHIIHIRLKKGQKAKYLGDNSKHVNERECLLPRNTTLKIHHKPTKLSCGTHVWHARVVDD